MRKPEPPKLKWNARASVWEIRWCENGRSRTHSTGQASQAEALQYFAGWLSEDRAIAREQSPTIDVILSDYEGEHVPACRDSARQRQIIKLLVAGFGRLRPEDINQGFVNEYVTKRGSARIGRLAAKPATCRRELGVLIAALNHAKRQKRIKADVVPHIELPSGSEPKDLWLTVEECDALRASYDPGSAIGLFIEIALATGARKASILRLKWAQVDMRARVIHFQSDGEGMTTKRRVPVPINERLYGVLCEADKGREYVLGHRYENIRPAFKAVLETANRKMPSAKWKRVTPHTLRHTWATLAAQRGVDLYQIAGVLGDTLATVTRNYLHHCPEHLRAAVEW